MDRSIELNTSTGGLKQRERKRTKMRNVGFSRLFDGRRNGTSGVASTGLWARDEGLVSQQCRYRTKMAT
jgi:hypothetical protein